MYTKKELMSFGNFLIGKDTQQDFENWSSDEERIFEMLLVMAYNAVDQHYIPVYRNYGYTKKWKDGGYEVILSRKKTNPIVFARYMVFSKLAERDYTLKRIGMKFGGMDHTSIIHGIKQARALVNDRGEIGDAFNCFEKMAKAKGL